MEATVWTAFWTGIVIGIFIGMYALGLADLVGNGTPERTLMQGDVDALAELARKQTT